MCVHSSIRDRICFLGSPAIPFPGSLVYNSLCARSILWEDYLPLQRALQATMPPMKKVRVTKQIAADSTTGAADEDDVAIMDSVKPAVPSPRKTRARAAKPTQAKPHLPDPEETSSSSSKGTKRPRKKDAAVVKTNGAATTSSSNVDRDVPSDDEPSESPQKKAKRTDGSKKAAKSTPEEDDDEPTTSKQTKKNGKASKGKKREAKPAPEYEEEEPTVLSKKQVVLKSQAPVDELCALANTCHVYCEGPDVWDVALNQTAINTNNNKYYIIQLLEHDSQKEYHVYQRWGRVGLPGQQSTVNCGSSLESAKKQFSKKFFEKTKNQWSDRANFEKQPGLYDMVLRDYTANETDAPPVPDVVDGAKSLSLAIPASTLAKPVQSLMEMIFNIKMMEQQVLEMNYDAKKAPLGKLTTEQVKSGYTALKTIAALLSLNDGADGTAAAPPARYDEAALTEACNQFYTKIPHAFGMRRPTLIQTAQQLKREMDLLETLGDIEVALRILKDASSKAFTESPIDRHYRTLNADISHIEHGSLTFEMIRDYLRTTHGPTHTDYELDVVQAYKLKKQADFDEHLGNRMLLWHGSRISNFAGILSQTLRIAPPEAPVTGYMFGKGIYFADVSSKSANYCYDTSSNGVGLMLLCDVALGTPNELLYADYNADKLPTGKHSTKGCGRHVPDSSTYRKLDDGVIVPIGKCVNLTAQDTRGSRSQFQGSLEYNEYIVYKQSQVRMRYLIQVRFDRGRRRH
ncbi:hypothetical protein RvY_08263-2 [Ramazzottius varieornatus]|nr:hypothetical protein RvY_08263-2 [Ramazzottius varieornatus]